MARHCAYSLSMVGYSIGCQAALAWTMGGPKGRRRTQQGFLGAQHFLEAE